MKISYTDDTGNTTEFPVDNAQFKAMLTAAMACQNGQSTQAQQPQQQQPAKPEEPEGVPFEQYLPARRKAPSQSPFVEEGWDGLRLMCQPARTPMGQFFQDPTVRMVGAGIAGLVIGGLLVGFMMSLRREN